MAARFWVGSTGTWDASDTTHWAATTGGAGGQSVPGSSDTATFDANSGGGTVTVDFGGTITIQSIIAGAFTGTLDFATNNNSITLSGSTAVNFSGTGTRTINLGNGTWTLNSTQALWELTTATNLTFNANSSTIAFTGAATTNQLRFVGGGRTYNVVTFVGGSGSSVAITGANTFATLTIAAPNRIVFQNSTTNTITNFTNISGTGTGAVSLITDNPLFGVGTISSANNWTGDFCYFHGMTFSGGGTFSGTNSFNGGRNTGITITAPSGGGGGGQRVISG